MPETKLQVLQLRPGVNREGTSYAGEGGWYACDKVRFRSGLPEKLGGWTLYASNSFLGTARNYSEFVSLSGYYLLAVGTNIKYYILVGGNYYDITPFQTINYLGNPLYSMYSTLSASITATQTIIPINNLITSNFNLLTPYVVRITTGATYEDVYVPTIDAINNTLGTLNNPCIRGYNGTAATIHNSGDAVSSSWLIIDDPSNTAVVGGFLVISGADYFANNLATQSGQELRTEDGDYLITSIIPSPYTPSLLNQEFQVQAVSNNYVAIDIGVQSQFASNGGANCYVSYELDPGSAYDQFFKGWGAGPWVSLTYAAGLSTLDSTITSVSTTIALDDASSFPASGYCYIESEIIQYTGKAGNSLTGCIRGLNQTAATGHMAGVLIEQVNYVATGTHAWSTGYDGSGFTTVTRQWSANNFGEMLYYNPRGGAIYSWDAGTGLTGGGTVLTRGVDISSGAFATVTADQIVVGNFYRITYVGDTDFTALGAASNTVGINFMATGAPAIAGTTGTVVDPAIPSVASLVAVTDERFIVAYGSNDAITALANPVIAGSFVTGNVYEIVFIGTTDFTDIGANTNSVGTKFTATGPGTGTGTAALIQQDPMFITWSSQEAPQVWYPTVTNTAGSYRLTYGSSIIAYEKTRQEILVWTDTALYSQQYLGTPYIYSFNPISVDITIVSQNAAVTATGVTYWMGQDKFYAYSGRVDTLPCALRQYIFSDINTEQTSQVYAGTNEQYNEIWWLYPSADSLINDRYVIYNYLEKLWYYGNMSRSAWLDSHIVGYPLAGIAAISASNFVAGSTYTISYIGDTDFTAIGATSNTIGLMFTATGAGSGTGMALPTTGLTVQHEFGTDDASVNPPQAIAAYIESADFDLGDGGYQFSFVKRIIPDMDFIGSSAADPSATMTLKARNYPGQGVAGLSTMQNQPAGITGSEVTTQVYNYTQDIWIRLRGRQLVFRVESDALGVKWQVGTPRLQIQPDGRR